MNSIESKSLERIYTHPDWWLNKLQREYFCEYVSEVLANPRFHDNTARSMLRYIWQGYDMGGHSVGRSPRSLLLEAAMKAMDHGEKEKTKHFLSVLIAMYHDINYINSHNWYDFKVEDFADNWLHDVFNLAIAEILLDIDMLPSVQELTNQDILKMVQS